MPIPRPRKGVVHKVLNNNLIITIDPLRVRVG